MRRNGYTNEDAPCWAPSEDVNEYGNGYRFARAYASVYGAASLLRAVRRDVTQKTESYAAGMVDAALQIVQQEQLL